MSFQYLGDGKIMKSQFLTSGFFRFHSFRFRKNLTSHFIHLVWLLQIKKNEQDKPLLSIKLGKEKPIDFI